MMSSARDLLQELDSERHRDCILVLTMPAPVVPLDRFVARWASRDLLLWDARGMDEDGWSFVGAGVALQIEAAGFERLNAVRLAAESAFARVVERRHGDISGAPPIRLFGGASFGTGTQGGPWDNFGEANFRLPRWLYGRRGDQAFYRVALRSDEVARTESALDEFEVALEEFSSEEGLHGFDVPGNPRLQELSVDDWNTRVASALAHIREGVFEKVVAARRSRVTTSKQIDVPELLLRIGAANPECARFGIGRCGAVFVGATPERLVSLFANVVACDALAGSRARGAVSDFEGVQSLLASEKDRREHAFVVTGITQALAPHCRHIESPDVPQVRTLRTVHHLWTPVTAELSQPKHVLDLVASLHPTPAVCGVPTAPAMKWISANEPEGRGWYAGPVGWFDAEGDGSFVVALRSALVSGSEAWLYAGAGIVEGSDAVAEFRETALKQSTMLAVLGVTS